jgi:hypothetical protein
MSKFVNLPTIDQFAAECRKNAIESVRRSVQYAREEAKQKVENAKQTRMAMERLDAAGIEVSCYGNTYVHIDLEFFHSTGAGNRKLAEAVRGIRKALGCQVKMDEKDLADAKKKLVAITLRPVNYPTVRIRYTRKLPKTAKCRIVTHRSIYRSLVCDVS